jgi:hypothetical protein
MQQAVNLEFEGRTAEAVRLLEEHMAESEMHTEEYLSHFFETRREKGLGPYFLENGQGTNGAAHKKKIAQSQSSPQAPRANRLKPKPTSQNDLLEAVNESTSTATLLQLQGKTQRLLSMRSSKDVEKAKDALKRVAKLKQELDEALAVLQGS